MSRLGLLYLFAAALTFGVGLAHSVLGERYILIRLFRRQDLQKLFGGTAFTARTLRLAWHVTTVAWWGAAALFLHYGAGSVVLSSHFTHSCIRLLGEFGYHTCSLAGATSGVACVPSDRAHRSVWIAGLTIVGGAVSLGSVAAGAERQRAPRYCLGASARLLSFTVRPQQILTG